MLHYVASLRAAMGGRCATSVITPSADMATACGAKTRGVEFKIGELASRVCRDDA